ncbi:Allergen Asp f 7 [Penicillium longicatenatum]|uniref:Allergen Asp f 7 n=1 Tax=Penicillium longicatenatum TaxID=1561947 RepID=UPI002548865F|nr:Allergen Asp f 7 [Penicillium longicatenatum]KAJ5635311.1 Allergen Asp f 7 [Penicillium longicatenatum]
MAPISKTLALAGALFAMAGVARPVEKRAVVWETVTDIVWTTVDVTTTVYPQEFVATATVVPVTTSAAAETTPTEKSKPEEYHQAETTSTSTSSTSTPAPAPETTEQPTTVAAVVEPTTSAAPVIEPTTSAAPVVERTSTSSTAAVATSASTSSSNYGGSCSEGSPCTGQMTYYDTATSASNPSACDTTNDGLTELVLALPVGIMTDSDCGKTVTISYGGVTKTGTVVDKCMGCDDTSVDLSRAFFEVFDSLSAGRLTDATWYIN